MSNDTHGTRANGVTKKLVTLGATLLAGLFTLSAQAFPELDLEVGSPDLMAAGINVTYDADAGTLFATGFASTLEGVGDIANGTFQISMSNIDKNEAGAQTGAVGTLLITGNGGTMLEGTLSSTVADPSFGGNGGTGALEFLFNVEGGTAADLYGNTAGVILSQSGFGGSFGSGWTTELFNGMADTFGHGGSVPVPGTLWLLLAGSGLLMFRRKKGTINNRA
jgi:hypothetical protein